MPIAATNSLIDLYCNLKPKEWIEYYRKLADDEAEEKKTALAARDNARDPNAKPSLPLAGYEGKYKHPAYGTATVTEKDGKLSARYSNFTYPLDHYERDTFRITDGFFEDELAVFTVKDGKLQMLKLSGIEFKRQ
jgi:hypothetical protein